MKRFRKVDGIAAPVGKEQLLAGAGISHGVAGAGNLYCGSRAVWAGAIRRGEGIYRDKRLDAVTADITADSLQRWPLSLYGGGRGT